MLRANSRKSGWLCVGVTLLTMLGLAHLLCANPTGPAIINGTVTIDTDTPGVMNITNSPNAIINWQEFSIQTDEITRFIQENSNSAVLNRVLGQNPSRILGQLLSNGKVFLINPNGIIFGADAKVDVQHLIASTLTLNSNDFLSGNYHFSAGDNPGDITNQGIIHAGRGGNIVLIAPEIENSGALKTEGGKIILAAGEKLTLTSLDNPDIAFEVQAPDNTILNVGEILSQGGAIDLFAGNITHSGIISANAVDIDKTGEIRLVAIDDINLASGSLISADGEQGADGGSISIVARGTDDPDNNAVVFQQGDIEAAGRKGGDIRIDADTMIATADIDADGEMMGGGIDIALGKRFLATDSSLISADGVTAGTIRVEADESLYTSGDFNASGVRGGDVYLLGGEVKLASAEVDVTGTYGGGNIRVGGGFQGNEPGIANSGATIVNTGTVLSADAAIEGDGGTVVVWADGETHFNGTITATGGMERGNGGMAEVSGKEALGYNGLVDLSASSGEAGTLLLDPKNIIISGTTEPQMIELVDPSPGASNYFGDNANTLGNGQIYVIDSLDDAAGADAGAFYTFDATTGDLVSSITGAQAGDRLGSSGIDSFTSGFYWLRSPNWGSGRGALTLFHQDTGISGVAGSSNSLVGLNAESSLGAGDGDRIGSYYNEIGLGSDRYFLRNYYWGQSAGALTWFDMTEAAGGSVHGVVDATTSLVGSTPNDQVGWNWMNLGNDKWAIYSPYWDNDSVADAGAITIVDAATGLTGVVSNSNSLVGTHTNDYIGVSLYYGSPDYPTYQWAGSNIIFRSYYWNGSTGALTWYDPTTAPLTGEISDVNSLVGSTVADNIGYSEIGNLYASAGDWWYIHSPDWDNGSAVDAGAVTFFDNANGFHGAISSATSLVGTHTGDTIGSSSGGPTSVGTNSNGGDTWVLRSGNWNSGAGALTWFDSDSLATNLLTGDIGSTNSLVGSNGESSPAAGDGDGIGTQFEWLDNFTDTTTSQNFEIYALISPDWDNGLVADTGAVTLIDVNSGTLYPTGTTVSGEISSANSLVGTHTGDRIGGEGIQRVGWASSINPDVSEYTYRYLVKSPQWNGSAGALTWFDTANGISGEAGTANSFVFANSGDAEGGSLLSMGNYRYLLIAPNADNSFGAANIADAGAVIWLNGNDGVLADGSSLLGTAGLSNGLFGAAAGSAIGSGSQEGVDYISGYYRVIRSPHWTDGGGADMGALTLFDYYNGTFFNGEVVPMVGALGSANSLTGETAGDNIGASGLFGMGGDLLVLSPDWDNGTIIDAGAVRRFYNYAVSGITGTHSAAESLIGGHDYDIVGSGGIQSLYSGAYLVQSPEWNGTSADNDGAGALTRFSTGLPVGVIDDANSFVGAAPGDQIGSGGLISLDYQGSSYKWLIDSPDFSGGLGALTFLDADDAGFSGIAGTGNSLVGGAVGDFTDYTIINESQLGYADRFALIVPNWDNGSTAVDAGAITFFDAALDEFLSGGTFAGGLDGGNSLVGTHTDDQVGSGGLLSVTSGTNGYIKSPEWNGGVGAWTWIGDLSAGIVGEVTTTNSLVGGSAGDMADYFTYSFADNKLGLFFYNWDAGAATDAGAITIIDRTNGLTGAIGSANSLVGDRANDRIGTFDPDYVYYYRTTYVQSLGGSNYMIMSPDWHDGAGALTWLDTSADLPVGAVSSGNSLVGSNAGDRVGITGTYYGNVGFSSLGNGRYYMLSPYWSSSAGAITWFDATVGVTGVLNSSNSLVGATANDGVGAYGVTSLDNGRYMIRAPYWDNGATVDAGALILTDASGLTGTISSANALIGSHANDRVGYNYINPGSGRYLFRHTAWNDYAGALTWYDSSTNMMANGQAPAGVISSANSLVGSTAGDDIGHAYINVGNDQYAFLSPYWDNGTYVDAGAVTIYDLTTGVVGEVSAANSLVGTHANDRVSDSYTDLGNSKWLFYTDSWNDNRGAVTWYDALAGIPLIGPISADNSLLGELAGDRIGTYITSLGDQKALIRSAYASVDGLEDAGRLHIFFYPFATAASDVAFGDTGAPPDDTLYFTTDSILATLNSGTNLILQATNDVSIDSALLATGSGSLILQAGRDILINQDVTMGAGATFNATANDTTGGGTRDDGTGDVVMAAGTTLTADAVDLTIDADAGFPAYEPGSFDLANIASTVSLTYQGEGGIPNRGRLILGDGETMTINGSLNNTGSIGLGLGSLLVVTGQTLSNAGTFSGSGTVEIGDQTSQATYGDFLNTGGILSPGDSPGALTIGGNLDLTGGTLILDIDNLPTDPYPALPDSNDFITVAGNVTMGGLLTVNTTGYTGQAVGDTFNVIQAGGTVSGDFTSTDFGIYGYDTGTDSSTFPGLIFLNLTSLDTTLVDTTPLAATLPTTVTSAVPQQEVITLTREIAMVTDPLDAGIWAAATPSSTEEDEKSAKNDSTQEETVVESAEEYQSLDPCK